MSMRTWGAAMVCAFLLVLAALGLGTAHSSPTVRHDGFPRVAFDGANYLVVWNDAGLPGNANLLAARVAADGTVLDPGGLPIATSASAERFPDVVFGAGIYLVIWEQDVGGTFDIYGARVAPDGMVLDPGGFAISDSSGNQLEAAVSFDGENFLVAWNDSEAGMRVHTAFVSPEGTVLDPEGIDIGPGFQPSVAFDGTNYVIAAERSGAIYAQRVATDGTVLDPAGIQISFGPEAELQSAVAFGESNYLIGWTEAERGPPPPIPTDVAGARLGTDGILLDTSPIYFGRLGTFDKSPSIAFDGEHFLGILTSDAKRRG